MPGFVGERPNALVANGRGHNRISPRRNLQLTGGRPNKWPDLTGGSAFRVQVFWDFRLAWRALVARLFYPSDEIDFRSDEVVEHRRWCCIEDGPAEAKPATVIAPRCEYDRAEIAVCFLEDRANRTGTGEPRYGRVSPDQSYQLNRSARS